MSLLSPDWEDDVSGAEQRILGKFEEETFGQISRPVNHTRIGFVSPTEQGGYETWSQRPRNILTSALTKNKVKDTSDTVTDLSQLYGRSHLEVKVGRHSCVDILARKPSSVSERIFSSAKVSPASAKVSPASGKVSPASGQVCPPSGMEAVTNFPAPSSVTESCLISEQMAFNQAPPQNDHITLGQNIEMCTLKFVDSPSVDDILSDWTVPPPAPSAGSGATKMALDHAPSACFHQTSTGVPGDGKFPASVVQKASHEPINRDMRNVANSLGRTQLTDSVDLSPYTSTGCCNSCLQYSGAGCCDDAVCANDEASNNNYKTDRHNLDQQHPQIVLQQIHHHQDEKQQNPPPHSYSALAANMAVPSPQQQQQPCCTGAVHASLNSDRRLPDYVTIDQCYSGMDDPECRTICLIANFDAGGNTKDSDTRHSLFPNQDQGHSARQGVPAEASSRKDRKSLRRGVMMRQMSFNPSHEQPMHLLSGKMLLLTGIPPSFLAL